MTTPALSVVMPVHNGLPYVAESISSILAQTFRDFELVVGDDGSDDGTSDVLAELAARDGRIRLLRREQRSGLAASAKWVVEQSSAPAVAVAHADDRSHVRRLERQMQVLEADPDVDLVGTLWDTIDEDGKPVRGPDRWRLSRPSVFAPFPHSSVMFRRRAFDRVGGYRAAAEAWEDLDLYLRLAAQGRIVVVPEVLTTVRHGRISARLRADQDRIEEAVDLMYRCVAEYVDGRDYTPLLCSSSPPPNPGRLHPLVFRACGSTRLWMGQRPQVFRRMVRRAALRLDVPSIQTVVWVAWATIEPRSLRLFLRLLLAARNVASGPHDHGDGVVEWRPQDARRPPG